jgi:homoserine O-succinyltransferase
MPIIIPDTLPAKEHLRAEEVFFMQRGDATRQDIRAMRILLLNLMPDKIATETQLIRLLSNSPLQMELFLLRLDSYTPKNTSKEHLFTFYQTFSEIRDQKFDGMIITGAPVEHMEFEEVGYWKELQTIMDWKLVNVTSCVHICWAAQAVLYTQYGIKKYPLEKKMFGVYPHRITKQHLKLFRGFDEIVHVPISRHTETRREDIERVDELEIGLDSEEAGVCVVVSKDQRQIYITGHPEYEPLTLKSEYDRDKKKGLPIEIPVNYFPDNDVSRQPQISWRANGNLLYQNWVNYHVYQETPHDLNQLKFIYPKAPQRLQSR